MSVKERLREFIEYKHLSERKFCSIVGLSSTYISTMRVSIQPEKVLMIAKQFPELNTGWLLTGEGEMLKADQEPAVESQPPGKLYEIILKQQETIAKLTDRLLKLTEDFKPNKDH